MGRTAVSRPSFLASLSSCRCVIICPSETDSTALQYMTPFAAVTVGAFLRDWGSNVLVVYDDMTSHFQTAHQYALSCRDAWSASFSCVANNGSLRTAVALGAPFAE